MLSNTYVVYLVYISIVPKLVINFPDFHSCEPDLSCSFICIYIRCYSFFYCSTRTKTWRNNMTVDFLRKIPQHLYIDWSNTVSVRIRQMYKAGQYIMYLWGYFACNNLTQDSNIIPISLVRWMILVEAIILCLIYI